VHEGGVEQDGGGQAEADLGAWREISLTCTSGVSNASGKYRSPIEESNFWRQRAAAINSASAAGKLARIASNGFYHNLRVPKIRQDDIGTLAARGIHAVRAGRDPNDVSAAVSPGPDISQRITN
jgi:hypothetical protein